MLQGLLLHVHCHLAKSAQANRWRLISEEKYKELFKLKPNMQHKEQKLRKIQKQGKQTKHHKLVCQPPLEEETKIEL